MRITWNQFESKCINTIKNGKISKNDPQKDRKAKELQKEVNEIWQDFIQGVENEKERKVYEQRWKEKICFNGIFPPFIGVETLKKKFKNSEKEVTEETIEAQKAREAENKKQNKNNLRNNANYSGIVTAVKHKEFCSVVRIGEKTYSVFDDFVIKDVEIGDEVAVMDENKNDGYQTLLELMILEKTKVQPEEIKKQPQQRKTRKTAFEKLEARVKSSPVSEKGTSFALLDTKCNIQSKDYRVWWITDCIAKSIIDNYGLPESKEDTQRFDFNREEIVQVEKEFERLKARSKTKYDNLVFDTILSCQEIRKNLGKSADTLSNQKIYELFQELFETTYTRMSPRIIDEKNGTYTREISFGKFCDVDVIESGRVIKRTKEPEYVFRVVFDKANAIDFYLSMRKGLFDPKPKSYYRTRVASQLIFRAVGWTPEPSTLELNHLCKIGKIKTKNTTWRKKAVEDALNQLINTGFISNWKLETKNKPNSTAKEYWYTIYKVKKLPAK